MMCKCKRCGEQEAVLCVTCVGDLEEPTGRMIVEQSGEPARSVRDELLTLAGALKAGLITPGEASERLGVLAHRIPTFAVRVVDLPDGALVGYYLSTTDGSWPAVLAEVEQVLPVRRALRVELLPAIPRRLWNW